ncbi:MAG: biotin transporter BioY [Heliobacteriaceae bacterium]|nr:biotin transporter BioY [Heliobacteriaceae bacterium]
MVKTNLKLVKRQVEGIRFSFAALVLALACSFLIVISTFIQFNFVHLKIYRFIPQIPTVLFAGAFLGRRYGLLSIILYIAAGLFFIPVFALGGGAEYIFEYGFGYILAYIPAVFFATSILQSGFSNRNIIQACLVGVLSIHLIGIIYMLFMAGIQHEDWTFIQNWISAQSGIKIIYDLIFSFLALFFARYARVILWFYM